MKTIITPALVLALAVLAGCVDDTAMVGGTSDVPLSDVDACESAVARQTGNSQVRTLSTEFSEANNVVMVGVGPNAAPWRCLISRGVVQEVMSMTNEGSL